GPEGRPPHGLRGHPQALRERRLHQGRGHHLGLRRFPSRADAARPALNTGTSRPASMTSVADFDPSTPSIARVYDYLLGGKDNFAVDREAAQRLMAVAPLAAEVTRENRQFLARAVAWAANHGITQFIDLGCGMPTAPNTHETARAISPGARVVYLDNDVVVLSHLRALAAKGNPGATVVDGDVREVATILDAVAAGIDLSA